MSNKVTWENIWQDFKRRHPRLCKEVVDWRPYDYLKIKLWMKDGRKIIYDYNCHIAKFESKS